MRLPKLGTFRRSVSSPFLATTSRLPKDEPARPALDHGLPVANDSAFQLGENAMTQRFVDLSIYLENDVVTDPPFMRPTIVYQTHHQTMKEAGHFFPGVKAEDLPGRDG